MVENWLITGGCGFIGRSLVKNLLAEGGFHIQILDNLKVGTREDLARVCNFAESNRFPLSSPRTTENSSPSPKVELLVGDILDADLAVNVCRDMDVIVHLAANTGVAPSVADPRMDCENNVIGTFNYLEAARLNRVKRFIFASSGAPAGEVEPPIHEELPPHPVSPYGASKLAGEGFCSAYYRTFEVETVCLRFGNVYGPLSGSKDSVVAKFIKRALAGKTLEIYGDGNQTRDFIYVDDLVKAIRLSAAKPDVGGEIFQIAANSETSVGKMTDNLIEILTEKGLKNIEVVHGKKRPGDVRRNFSDTSKAMNKLGWRAETGLKKGLELTIDWFLEKESK